MSIICFFTGILLSLITKIKEKNVYNPTFFFCLFFGIISLLSGLRLYGMVATSDIIYFIIIVGLVSFFIGYLLATKLRIKLKSFTLRNNGQFKHDRIINNKILYCLIIFSIIFTCYRFASVFSLMRRGVSLDMIRLAYYGYEVEGFGVSKLVSTIEMYINTPILFIAMPIFSIVISNKKYRTTFPKILLILIFIDILISQIVTGGRVYLFVFIMELLFALLIENKGKITSILKKYKFVFLIILIILYVMSILTANRGNPLEQRSIFKSLYLYFCGGIPNFSYNIDYISGYSGNGLTLIAGWLNIIFSVLDSLLGVNFHILDGIYKINEIVGTNVLQITPMDTYNSFVTMFCYFYADFGFVGIIFETIIFSYVVNCFYFQMKRNQYSLYSVAWYLLVFHGLLMSFIKYPYITVNIFVAPFIMLLIFKKTRKEDKN